MTFPIFCENLPDFHHFTRFSSLCGNQATGGYHKVQSEILFITLLKDLKKIKTKVK